MKSVVAPLSFLVLLACSAEGPGVQPSIEASELAARLSSGNAPVILDVRSEEEFESGHIPGAIHIPHTELPDRLASLEPLRGQEIVVHCERGGRAAAAEAVLREAGHTRVRDLSGHMSAWREAGHPVE